MTDPLTKMLLEEQKKIDAKLRYRRPSVSDITLPDVLPDLIPSAPQNEKPDWIKQIKQSDKSHVKRIMKAQKKQKAKISDIMGEPTQQRGKKRRLK